MIRSCVIVLLFLISLLANPVLGRSQVNRRLAMDYVKLGTNELEAGNLDAALAHFERAIELDPRAEIPQAHLLLGLLLAERGITQEAMEQFHAFLKLVPTGAEAEKAREQIRKWEQTAKTR